MCFPFPPPDFSRATPSTYRDQWVRAAIQFYEEMPAGYSAVMPRQLHHLQYDPVTAQQPPAARRPPAASRVERAQIQAADVLRAEDELSASRAIHAGASEV
jgi:hypothetical protein